MNTDTININTSYICANDEGGLGVLPWEKNIRIDVKLWLLRGYYVFGRYHFYEVDKNTYRLHLKGDKCIASK